MADGRGLLNLDPIRVAWVRIPPPPLMDKNLVLISGAIVYRYQNDKVEWFLVRHQDTNEWEIPKVTVRKGESSVRAALRIMGEKGAMTTRVLEEAGRAGGTTTLNGKTVPQRYIYYLMVLKLSSKEPIGFQSYEWFEYPKAIKKLSSKRETSMLRDAKDTYKKWKKERKARRKKQA